ncbi:MAG: hypothetical protein E7389_00245 [Ruminococcaceae bacterium]|nr:hypothetical protein [Oscillospiraceae bacterium]
MRGKRVLTTLLATALCLSPVSAGAFSDLNGHWAGRFVESLSKEGIIADNGAKFMPDEYISVNEFIGMVLSVMQVSAAERTNAVVTAKKLGLIYDGEFADYTHFINRGEIAKIAARAINAKEETGEAKDRLILKLSDYYDIYNEYKDSVLAVFSHRIMSSYEDNSFRIGRLCTRAEACVIISRIASESGFKSPNQDAAQTNIKSVYYVSNDGDDSNDGGEASPFKTPERARNEIRKAIASGAYSDGGITVYLRGGEYKLSESFILSAEDSGKADAPITYTSYPGETAMITGTETLAYDDFRQIEKTMADKIIDKSAAGKVLEIDLTKYGITDLGALSRRGFLISADVAVQPELYIDGNRMQLARWPNSEWVGTSGIVRSGARSKQGVLEGAVFNIDYNRPMSWKTNINEIYTSGVLGPNYFYGYFPIEKIEPGKITLKEGSVTEYYSKHFIRYENIFEELDMPGEYYIDRTSGKMYLYPPVGFGKDTDIRLSVFNGNLITLSGAKNIRLKNLFVSGTRSGAIRAENTEGFTVENCEISDSGAAGIYIRGTNCTVKNNLIHDIGATAISVSGGDYANRISGGNAIINNHIYRAAQIERSYQSGISLGYQSVGTLVSHNEIHDMPHAAMIVYGPDHIIEYNNIYDAVKEFHDMDAIYLNVNQYPWERNVVIRRNYIHDLGKQMFTEKQMNIAGIRTDNHGNGLTVSENIFYNIGYENSNGIRGICAQGIENVITNNIFVDTAGTYEGEHTFNPDGKWELASDGDKEIYRQWQVYSPKYSEKNPEVAKFFDNYYTAYEKNNIFKGNVIVNIAFPLSTANYVPTAQGYLAHDRLVDAADNIVTAADPGFKDYKGRNFALKDDSDIYKKNGDFPKIDFENIGLISGETVGTIK